MSHCEQAASPSLDFDFWLKQFKTVWDFEWVAECIHHDKDFQQILKTRSEALKDYLASPQKAKETQWDEDPPIKAFCYLALMGIAIDAPEDLQKYPTWVTSLTQEEIFLLKKMSGKNAFFSQKSAKQRQAFLKRAQAIVSLEPTEKVYDELMNYPAWLGSFLLSFSYKHCIAWKDIEASEILKEPSVEKAKEQWKAYISDLKTKLLSEPPFEKSPLDIRQCFEKGFEQVPSLFYALYREKHKGSQKSMIGLARKIFFACALGFSVQNMKDLDTLPEWMSKINRWALSQIKKFSSETRDVFFSLNSFEQAKKFLMRWSNLESAGILEGALCDRLLTLPSWTPLFIQRFQAAHPDTPKTVAWNFLKESALPSSLQEAEARWMHIEPKAQDAKREKTTSSKKMSFGRETSDSEGQSTLSLSDDLSEDSRKAPNDEAPGIQVLESTDEKTRVPVFLRQGWGPWLLISGSLAGAVACYAALKRPAPLCHIGSLALSSWMLAACVALFSLIGYATVRWNSRSVDASVSR